MEFWSALNSLPSSLSVAASFQHALVLGVAFLAGVQNAPTPGQICQSPGSTHPTEPSPQPCANTHVQGWEHRAGPVLGHFQA